MTKKVGSNNTFILVISTTILSSLKKQSTQYVYSNGSVRMLINVQFRIIIDDKWTFNYLNMRDSPLSFTVFDTDLDIQREGAISSNYDTQFSYTLIFYFRLCG